MWGLSTERIWNSSLEGENELYVSGTFVETIHGDENLVIRMRLLSLLEVKYDIEK